MLKLIKNISLVFILMGVFSIGTHDALAEARSGDRVVVDEGEVINDDLFITAGSVEIEGIVNGDVYIAGQNIEISGEINGDLLVGGETIVITGIVRDDIRGAGQTLTLEGATVNDGVMFFGGEVSILEDTEINGSVLFFGREIETNGHITRSLRANAETVEIGGEVNGNVQVNVRALALTETAVVDGDLNYTAASEADIAQDAEVNGETNPEITRGGQTGDGLGAALGPLFVLFSFLSMLVTGIVLLIFFKGPIQAVADIIRTKPLRTLAIGAIVMVAFAPVFAILLVSVVGIPLALLTLALFVAAAYFSTLFVSIAVGRYVIGLVRADKVTVPNAYLSFFLGLLILFILFQVPYLGVVVKLAVTLMGFGVFVYGIGRVRRWA